jgi:hypothetical protein
MAGFVWGFAPSLNSGDTILNYFAQATFSVVLSSRAGRPRPYGLFCSGFPTMPPCRTYFIHRLLPLVARAVWGAPSGRGTNLLFVVPLLCVLDTNARRGTWNAQRSSRPWSPLRSLRLCEIIERICSLLALYFFPRTRVDVVSVSLDELTNLGGERFETWRGLRQIRDILL